MKPLEALADAISKISGYNDPENAAYRNRNPLGLRAFSDKHPRDVSGMRIFQSALDGYQAGLFDLTIKCNGKSNTHLRPSSTLLELIRTYHQPDAAAKYVARFLRHALQDESITEKTELAYFLG